MDGLSCTRPFLINLFNIFQVMSSFELFLKSPHIHPDSRKNSTSLPISQGRIGFLIVVCIRTSRRASSSQDSPISGFFFRSHVRFLLFCYSGCIVIITFFFLPTVIRKEYSVKSSFVNALLGFFSTVSLIRTAPSEISLLA